MISTILSGIGAGITYSLTAWSKKQGQKFDVAKFGTTVIIGGLAGLGMGLLQLPIAEGYVFLVNLGIVPVVENAIKAFMRKLVPMMK